MTSVVQASSLPSKIETAAPDQAVDEEPVQPGPVEGVSVEIQSAADVVLAGSDFSASLLINNRSGLPIEILEQGCAPKWNLAMTSEVVGAVPGIFNTDCSLEPFVVPVGESSHNLDVPASYRLCGLDESGGPLCEGSPPVLPPLPPGEYSTVLEGSLPGLPIPEPRQVHVVDTLSAVESDDTTPLSDDSSYPPPIPVAEGFVYLDDGLVYTDLAGQRLDGVDFPPGQAQILSADQSSVYLSGGQHLHVVTDRSVSTIETGGIVGPLDQYGYWVARWTRPGELVVSFTTLDGDDTTTFTASVDKGVIVGSYASGAVIFDLANGQLEFSAAETETVGIGKGLPLALSDNLLYSWDGEAIVELDLDNGARRSVGDYANVAAGATFGAAGLSPDRSRLAMVLKDPDNYDVVGIALVELETGLSTIVPIDRGEQIEWIDQNNVVLYADTTAYVLNIDTLETYELDTDTHVLAVRRTQT